MITTELYRGQGLGNQLWVYAVCRTLALDRGVPFGIQAPERFKGRAFLDLDFGGPVVGALHEGPSPDLPEGVRTYVTERRVLHEPSGSDITPYDPRIAAVEDGTKIDGILQAEQYIAHRRTEISGWFASQVTAKVPDDVCVISFRGGEYQFHPELMLKPAYYRQAIAAMEERHGGIRFVVVTDDPPLARRYFPDLQIVAHRRVPALRRIRINPSSKAIGGDFSWVQRAKALILSNSSFSWWGAWTNPHDPVVIAPTYWARHNVSDGYWSQGDALTSGWNWLDRDGRQKSFEECAADLAAYRSVHPETLG